LLLSVAALVTTILLAMPIAPVFALACVETIMVSSLVLGLNIWPPRSQPETLAYQVRNPLNEISKPPRQWFFSRSTAAIEPLQETQVVRPNMGMTMAGGGF
jgi:hypothetical protein